MDPAQQFCLRWNNYQTTLNHIFHKLWQSGTFVDVTLAVEDQKIKCHKIILSACSTYFEKLLMDHPHPNPLIILHDISYSTLVSLITFMYNGEINVSHDQLASVLKVADTLKVKGLADSEAISNFARMRLLGSELNVPTSIAQYYPSQYLQDPSLFGPHPTSPINSSQRSSVSPYSRGSVAQNLIIQNSLKRSEPNNNGIVNPKKRSRRTTPTSLPPSPPISLGDTQNHEQARTSPEENMDEQVKIEVEEETDTELQIDESADQSPEESVESDSLLSNRNTPVTEFDSQELRERHETAAQSLAALASQGAFPNLVASPQLLLAPKNNSVKVKEEKTSHGGKNGEKAYTYQDLEEGIEAVLAGILTPAKAIAKYKIPRRTFFRRLSSVRKLRGIPSSKENASENYHSARSNQNATALQANRNLPVGIPGLVMDGSAFNQAKGGTKLSKSALDNANKESYPQGLNLSTTGGMLNLLQMSNPNYENYLEYFNHSIKSAKDIKKEIVDDNSNISSSETTDQPIALVTQNGS